MSPYQTILGCGFGIFRVSSVPSPAALGSISNDYSVINSGRQKRAIGNAQVVRTSPLQPLLLSLRIAKPKPCQNLKPSASSVPTPPPLDLTEDNIRRVLADAQADLGQIFDTSVGITGDLSSLLTFTWEKDQIIY